MATYRIDSAGHADLLAFVTGQLNLPVPPNPTKAQLREVIRSSGFLGTSFDLDDDERRQAAAAVHGGRTVDPDYTHVKLLIAYDDNPGGREPIALSVNGRAYYVPRGEPVVIPRKYYEGSLKNAVQVIYPETPEPKSADEPALSSPLETPRWSYSVLEFLTDPGKATAA